MERYKWQIIGKCITAWWPHPKECWSCWSQEDFREQCLWQQLTDTLRQAERDCEELYLRETLTE